MMELKRGAEAVLWLDGDHVVKERVKKGYRLEEIDDKLRKLRTKKEAKLLSDAKRCGVSAPGILSIDENGSKISMEYIEGKRLKEFFNETDDQNRQKVAELVGRSIGILHKSGIVHGDLTTSNMILKDGKVYFIDFGLGESSSRAENQAMDISVLREAIKSTHFNYLNLIWNSFIEGYKQTNGNFNKVLQTLNDIEKRGRYVRRDE